MTIEGGCHCGAIRFSVEGGPTQVMECNCSHCSRKGFLLWFVGDKQFTVRGDESAMIEYRFNKHAIAHRICAICGVQPFARGKTPDGKGEMVAVNLRCVPDFDRASVEIVPVDGKSF